MPETGFFLVLLTKSQCYSTQTQGIVAVGVWIFGIPMITSPEDGLAVKNFVISDANLYFASWGALIFALWILASVFSERCVSASRESYSKRWMWLIVSSAIAMSSASRIFDKKCSEDAADSERCKELKMGIALGVVSAVIAGVMTLLLFLSPSIIPVDPMGFFLCLACLGIWCTCLAYLTFENGAGSIVGNLFFSVWASTILAFDLTVCYAKGFMA